MKAYWLLPAALALVAAAAPDGPGPVVATDTGRVRGIASERTEAFLAIPYAAPPVGALRWRPPQRAARWSGVRDAGAIGPDCVQARDAGNPHAMAEDCLSINVWRPASRRAGALAVVVWIHGGGYVAGGSSDPQTDGAAFARDGIIAVTFNYRLGRLGFFGFPALSAEYPREAKGNYGLLDQIAALQWVKRNIASFGGDPRRVTVMGESAGGESVLMLAGSPMAHGLFARAIVQSGGGAAPLLGRRLLREDAAGGVSAEKAGLAFARSTGIEGEDAAALARLRALPAARINDGLSMVSLVFGGLARFTGPVEDGRLVTAQPDRALRARRGAIPLLIGTTDADLGLGRARTKDEAFAAFGDPAAARGAYDPEAQAQLAAVNTLIGADRTMTEPARRIARITAGRGVPAWRFRFGYVATPIRGKPVPGAEHASDVAYAFGTIDRAYPSGLTPQDAEAQRLFHGYFAQFVKTGDPNGAGLPHWPRAGGAGDPLMVFRKDATASAGADPWKTRLDLTAGAAPGR
ncbi:carboxylesterase family protein [uncultured Sphingomonas sp.]|uniref:carboxylesterase/lipase family protein n=1 Tax=uncultured Sphingomonas sp. TaxID=158754 RepID=UPI00262B6383|nr:carboxylesterase family protein [uncultured Sphingomonas sp.]